MAEQILITVANVQEYRNISNRWNDSEINERFNSYALEVQRINLRELLKPALYLDLVNKYPDGGIYDDLVNGVEYIYSNETIKFEGLKPFLCYHWLAIETNEGDLFHSTYGNIDFVNNPQQNFNQSKLKLQAVQRYIENANSYRNDIIQFLNEKSSIYTLWKGDNKTRKTNFQISII